MNLRLESENLSNLSLESIELPFPEALRKTMPTVKVDYLEPKTRLSAQIELAGLEEYGPVQVWRVEEHSKALAYATHGIARYFGKFPPPIARHFLEHFSEAGNRVLDPMCGSGTAILEGLIAGRDVIGFDLNPLAVTISTAKVQYISASHCRRIVARLDSILPRVRPEIPAEVHSMKNLDHWFLGQTIDGLARIRRAIDLVAIEFPLATPILQTTFAAIIRRCSRATSQQGRLFLDASSAVSDPLPIFRKRLAENLVSVSDLVQHKVTIPRVRDAKEPIVGLMADAAILHPPYFNSYKYSSVLSLELAWLGIPRGPITRTEVREGFKRGKSARLTDYIADLTEILRNTASAVKRGGHVALMLGDTVLCGDYIRVAKPLINIAESFGLSLESIAVRPPKFTEASWVTSQRRGAEVLGANMADYVLVFTVKNP